MEIKNEPKPKWGIHKGNGSLIPEGALVAILEKDPPGHILAFKKNESVIRLSGQNNGENYKTLTDVSELKKVYPTEFNLITDYLRRNGYDV